MYDGEDKKCRGSKVEITNISLYWKYEVHNEDINID